MMSGLSPYGETVSKKDQQELAPPRGKRLTEAEDSFLGAIEAEDMTMMRTLPVALLVVVLATAANAAYLQNGTFDEAGPPTYPTYETTEIPHWTVSSDESLLLPDSAQSGVFYVVGDVFADTEEMVLLSTWPDREPTEPRLGPVDITQMTSDPFLVSGDHKWIEFSYVFLTQEPLDGQADVFQVSLIRASDEAILYDEFIATALDSDLIDSPAISDVAAFVEEDGRNNRQSDGWQHWKYDMSALAGETVRLVFTVSDVGDDVYNSGVLLENVLQTPEPATFVFFGLGALGLGYAVRRRRRMAKK